MNSKNTISQSPKDSLFLKCETKSFNARARWGDKGYQLERRTSNHEGHNRKTLQREYKKIRQKLAPK